MARRPGRQDVELVDDDLDDDRAHDRASRTAEPGDGPAHPRRRRRTVAAAAVVALVVGGAVTAQVVQDHREDARLAALADLPDVARPVDDRLRVLWTDEDRRMWNVDLRTPDDLLVTRRLADAPSLAISVAGVDARTGAVVWETELLDAARTGVDPAAVTSRSRPPGQCVADPADAARIVCAVDDRIGVAGGELGETTLPATQARVVTLRTSDGTVVDEVQTPGLRLVSSLVAVGPLLVLAATQDDEVRVVALRADRSVAWERTLPAGAPWEGNGGRPAGFLSRYDDGVAVRTFDALTLLDAAGAATEVDVSVEQLVGAPPDLLVLSPPVDPENAGDGGTAPLRVVTPDTEVRAEGWLTLPTDDGSVPGLVLTRAPGGELRAWDAQDGEIWSTGTRSTDGRAVVLDGRVHVTHAGGLLTVDARTGAELWSSDRVTASSGVVTDGRVLLGLAPRAPDEDTREVLALDRVDGSTVWSVRVPLSVDWLTVLGGQVVGVQEWRDSEVEPPLLVLG